MPALSPTMTEGNISSWKVKEGDSFVAGDILLEVETDKASMDVEAQDDGKMAKIFVPDGSKAVQVGARIGVLADADDDLSSLEIPADDSKPISSPAENVKKAEESGKDASSTSAAAPKGTPENPRPSRDRPATSPQGPGATTKYPLYPSVVALVHENHISDADVAKIPASGPNNRLLKGDVLGFLHQIPEDYSSKQSERIEHMGHLDLSNIKIMPAPKKPAVPTTEQAAPTIPEAPLETSITLPISLGEVLKVQKRLQDTMGVSLPLSTFLARAVDIANDDLPIPKGRKPSADELFNSVLGLDTLPSTTSRGTYLPQIDALPLSSTARAIPKTRFAKKPDIIDILTGRAGPMSRTPRPASVTAASMAAGGVTNLFSVTVPAGEEKRARTFMERMKTTLQTEPGRLVL